MMLIPDYLIHEEFTRKEKAEREAGFEPLYLPLYAPEIPDQDERPDHVEVEDEPSRGVILIDMTTC